MRFKLACTMMPHACLGTVPLVSQSFVLTKYWWLTERPLNLSSHIPCPKEKTGETEETKTKEKRALVFVGAVHRPYPPLHRNGARSS